MQLDHFGIVVKDIGAARQQYKELFQLSVTTDVISDPLQRVWVQFLADKAGTRWELIQPMDERSPAWNALRKGGGLNHFCYSTVDLDRCIELLRAQNCVIVCQPTPGAGHDGRRIAFMVSPELGLIELVESVAKVL